MNPTAEPSQIVHQFREDTTIRWSCRRGEYVLWLATGSLLTASLASSWKIRDFWQMRDGDYLTITNRWADLPGWFQLHPSEVANGAACEMLARLNAGYQLTEVMDGPNLWRAKTGDRIVCVSIADSRNPVNGLLNLRSCALVLGENPNPTSDSTIAFGAPDGDELPTAAAAAMRTGFDLAVALGAPREVAPEWQFGL